MSYQDLINKIEADIKKFGRSIIAVPDDAGAFAYTIGNYRKGMPELIVVAPLKLKDAEIILNAWSKEQDELGQPFEDGDEHRGSGAKWPVRFAACKPDILDTHACFVANVGGHGATVLQMLIPDRDGLFPDNPQCAYPYNRQPILGAL